MTPIFLAVHQGNKDVVECLLKHKARVNISTLQGHTPVLLAAHRGRLDITKLLVEHGDTCVRCATLTQDSDGDTILHCAAQHPALLKYFVAHMNERGHGCQQ